MMHLFSFKRRLLPAVLLAAIVMAALAALVSARAINTHAQSSSIQAAAAPQTSQVVCKTATCTFQLQVNPGLVSGPFACPAIQNAKAHITITNRFITGAQNDVMTLAASGLPKNTGFDMFLVQNTPLDTGTFAGFGFGWYQSDVQSDSNGNAKVRVQGIFDKETFILNPADPFVPIHTFNVGFWFDSPIKEAKVCGNPTPPAKTPFNGEQNAGLLAMITQGEPLHLVR
jgi:hypothetical protein